MTRILTLLTLVTALLVAVTAGLIRYELAAPGVSALFSNSDGRPNGLLFNEIAVGHAMLCYLCVMLIGTSMISAARDQAARFSALFLTLAVVLTGATVLFVVALMVPVLAPYVMMPLDYVAANFSTELIYVDMSRLFILPAAALLYVGAYALLSTLPRLAWMGAIGAVVVAIVLVFTLPLAIEPGFAFAGPFRAPLLYALIGPLAAQTLTSPAVLMGVPFLMCAAVYMISARPAWLVFVSLGLLALIAVRYRFTMLPAPPYYDGTMYDVALFYILPLGLAWFALPAMLAFRHGSDLPLWAVIGAAVTIVFGLYRWTIPLMQLGLMGQPMRYIDYPTAFAELNLAATQGVFGFMILYGSIVLLAARARR